MINYSLLGNSYFLTACYEASTKYVGITFSLSLSPLSTNIQQN